ncbi:MAG: LysR family transcriptional regulator [Kouleothrix sp.]|nr:LysR family transcriptional regulator [Kouleothrix sp.]
MDIPKLRIFATVARLGNFTRAAELLYLTQPTVSQQIAALEAQVGAPLIERLPRRLRLTPAGEALLPYAEQILALATDAAEAARAAAGLADRTLRLGAGHTLATYLLPDLLSRYRDLYPRRLVRISVGNTAELLELVATDTVELALVGSPADHARVIVAPFMHDRLVVIVAPDDAWAAREAIELAELPERVLLTREPGSALHATVERLLGPATLAGDRVILLGETEAIKRSVEAGLGVALVQEIAVEREVAAGNLRALALRGGDDTRTYAYARRAGRPLSGAAEDLVALLAHLR